MRSRFSAAIRLHMAADFVLPGSASTMAMMRASASLSARTMLAFMTGETTRPALAIGMPALSAKGLRSGTAAGGVSERRRRRRRHHRQVLPLATRPKGGEEGGRVWRGQGVGGRAHVAIVESIIRERRRASCKGVEGCDAGVLPQGTRKKEFKQNKSLSQQTGSTQVRTGAC